MTQEQLEAIEHHGRQLLAIFPNATERDPLRLCKKLRVIERHANIAACDYCNGECGIEKHDRIQEANIKALKRILGDFDKVPVFINGDPRGYALKIDDEYMRANNVKLHRDWGGYGIIAPEIDKNGNH